MALSRRGFLQRSFAALTAAGLPSWAAVEVLAAEQEKPANKAGDANDRILMGAIGIGSPSSRNRSLVNEARRDKNVQFVAVCDVDSNHVDRAAQEIGGDVKKFHDFRELLDDKSINAVTIATPDHWHALIAIDALRKGKDVYCEKPMTLTIAEGIALSKVAKDTGRIFQVGSQQRSDARFRLACELVRNGRIGKVKRVETRIGTNPVSPELPVVEVPKGLDWDMWLGPTPKVDYVEMKKDNHTFTRGHYEFRWWYDYSGGKMTDWGAHHNDIAQWGLGMDESGPVAIEAEAEAPPEGKNRYNTHPTFKVSYTYANGIPLLCAHTQLPDAIDPQETKVTDANGKETKVRHSNGILFVGEDGKWIFVNRQIITASDPKLIDEPLPKDAVRLYATNGHMANFLEGVRTRKPTICTADVGHRSVSVCHLGVIALRSGKKLKWDPAKQQFDDAEANKMLSRPMRAPWKIEV